MAFNFDLVPLPWRAQIFRQYACRIGLENRAEWNNFPTILIWPWIQPQIRCHIRYAQTLNSLWRTIRLLLFAGIFTRHRICDTTANVRWKCSDKLHSFLTLLERIRGLQLWNLFKFLGMSCKVVVRAKMILKNMILFMNLFFRVILHSVGVTEFWKTSGNSILWKIVKRTPPQSSDPFTRNILVKMCT